MNVYRVQYYHITGSITEHIRGHEFVQRKGTEKTAFVVAPSPEVASAHIAGKHNCEILGIHTQLANVEVAEFVPVVATPAPPVKEDHATTKATELDLSGLQ
jgi:hypothetical protein